MTARHEAPKQKNIPEYQFQPEEWIEPSDREFFTKFMDFLESKGFDPRQLVFSGFDGEPLLAGERLPRNIGIHGMNYAGWERTLNQPGKYNPAMYADHRNVKCIGIYDRNLLAEAFLPEHPRKDPVGEDFEELDHSLEFLKPVISVEQAYDPPSLDEMSIGGHRYEIPSDPTFRDDDFEIRDADTSIQDTLKGENLSDLPIDYPVEEGVLHRDYPDDPNARPADAMIGIVFYKPFQPKADRRGPRYRF